MNKVRWYYNSTHWSLDFPVR